MSNWVTLSHLLSLTPFSFFFSYHARSSMLHFIFVDDLMIQYISDEAQRRRSSTDCCCQHDVQWQTEQTGLLNVIFLIFPCSLAAQGRWCGSGEGTEDAQSWPLLHQLWHLPSLTPLTTIPQHKEMSLKLFLDIMFREILYLFKMSRPDIPLSWIKLKHWSFAPCSRF